MEEWLEELSLAESILPRAEIFLLGRWSTRISLLEAELIKLVYMLKFSARHLGPSRKSYSFLVPAAKFVDSRNVAPAAGNSQAQSKSNKALPMTRGMRKN